jgi:hypothetical protein
LVEKTYPSSHGGGGGGSEVAGVVDAVDDLSGAADGSDGVGPEAVGSEEMVLGAGLARWAAISLGPPVAARRAVLGESAARRWCSEPELGRNDPEY